MLKDAFQNLLLLIKSVQRAVIYRHLASLKSYKNEEHLQMESVCHLTE